MNTEEFKQDRLTLEVLEAVDRRNDISQRSLAQEMGVALGLANSYLKRCVRKGYIKIKQAPANRYLYYLTPKGFSEKSRLTAEYLSVSLSFYRQACASCDRVFESSEIEQVEKLVLCGASDLAEIAILRAMKKEVSIGAVYDPGIKGKQFFAKPLVNKIPRTWLGNSLFMLTDLAKPHASFKHLVTLCGEDKVLAPDILRIESLADKSA